MVSRVNTLHITNPDKRIPDGGRAEFTLKSAGVYSQYIVSGCIVHVSVCIEAHVPNHYVTTRYRSIHVRYITIQRIGRPHPHLQTRYTVRAGGRN